MKYIVGVRHGEKSAYEVYGGNGSPLTPKGQEQIRDFANSISKMVKDIDLPINIYCSGDRDQVIQSAEIISETLQVDKINKSNMFKSIRLGVFDGMSREKQMKLYPDACEAHSAWEKGLIDVTESERLVEGMQPASEYYDQISTFLHCLPDETINILVGTRSDLSCLENVIRGQSPREYMAYKYNPFQCAQSTMARMEKMGEIEKIDNIEELFLN